MSVRGHVLLFGWAFMELLAAEFDPWAQERRGGSPPLVGFRVGNESSPLEEVRAGSKT